VLPTLTMKTKDKEKEEGERPEPDEPLTDTDGWIYAGNRWEGSSGKGGMGKVRIAFGLFPHVGLTWFLTVHAISKVDTDSRVEGDSRTCGSRSCWNGRAQTEIIWFIFIFASPSCQRGW
jgi:hypothetical protein